nr:MAG TPA: hypothetical protein [Caudoviricetes sp.]DAF69143.1 MAG TPA: hypothetical protein [Caudoviricetes sp.]DAL72138.1 MAG TPA: hypothetical protein [Caudoviricetes sp.]
MLLASARLNNELCEALVSICYLNHYICQEINSS